MTYELLVSTMNQQNCNIYDEMNLNSNAIIINQSNYWTYEEYRRGIYLIKMLSSEERGIGLSRNTALMRSTADIIEFADDDMIFSDTYSDDVINEFEKHPEADAILFNINSLNNNRPLIKIDRFRKVSRREALKYGCARLAVKREKIIYNNITFSLLFGGGAKFGSGEDTIFLQDCIKAGLKIYKSPVKIADVKQDTSSWFKGYTDKYYFDKGALFFAALGRLSYLYAAFTAFKNSENFKEFCRIFKLYLKGMRTYEKLK